MDDKSIREVFYDVFKSSDSFVGVGVHAIWLLYLFQEEIQSINGFEAAFKAGRKSEKYAKRVGMVEFIIGIPILIAGIALIISG